jgi:hypothetical protein
MLRKQTFKGTIWRRIGWLTAECLVVFIGVYLAFLLEGYRTAQQNEQKQQQIYSALYTIFDGITADLENADSFQRDFAEPFLEAYENGEMPRPRPLPFAGSGFSTDSWSAMLEVGGINLLDVKFILRIEEFYAGARFVDKTLSNYNSLSNQILLPNAEAELETFYNTETGLIRPQFSWYIEFMRSFPNSIENLDEGAGEILTALEEKMNSEQLEIIQQDNLEES